MPTVLVNPGSGLAESFDDPNLLQEKLDSGYHVPLHDANGNAFSAPYNEAKDLVATGQYRQPNPDELNTWVKTAHFQKPTEQAKAFIEGAARGVAGPLATGVELAAGVPAENIAARKSLNPATALSGEALTMGALTLASGGFFGEAKAGIAAASLPGIISEAGQTAAKAISMEGTFGNIARAATASAIEGGLFAAQNRVTEAMIGDPNSFSEHILADVGISALLSGAAGGALAAGLSPFSKIAKQVERTSSLIKENLPEEVEAAASSTLKKGPFPNFPPKLDEPLFEAAATQSPTAKDFMSRFKGALPDIGPSDIVSLIKNPYHFTAYQLGKMVEKVTLPKLTEMFSEQAPKVVSILESFKMGLNTVSKIEQKAAGLFGYDVYRASQKPENPLQLHGIYDDTNAIESDPGIFIKQMQKHTEPMADNLPDTTIALSKAVGNAINLVKEARPNLQKAAPFDSEPIPSQVQVSKFNTIANTLNHPLSVMDHVKLGTLTQDHLNVMRQVYPSVLQNMQKEAVKNMTRYQAENKTPLPYKVRLGLSTLLEQPLDSSLLSLSKNQMALSGMNMAKQQTEAAQARPSKSGMGKMKFLSSEKTRAQQSLERVPA